uniref:Exoribonuclease phosphorolytic domain-containing protein n=1 Tax=Guillardia theta TaxID=55529 RepID=A0A6U5YXN1_GUITH|mmetsp:Transcript_24098/g.78428  ORF Transcript_24098/g.78428 Transcript_24098/m.78428 type:complete len:290 (+) Transcript_24098:170-1039(+)
MSSSIISKSDRAFIEQAAKESQRVDGRRLLDHRRVRIHFHVQPGMVEVQLGTCRVLGVVSAALVVPPAERPAEGIVSLDLLPLPLADSSTDANRASETMKDGRAILQRAIVKSRCVDVESLCVIAGKAVWKVTVELKVLGERGGEERRGEWREGRSRRSGGNKQRGVEGGRGRKGEVRLSVNELIMFDTENGGNVTDCCSLAAVLSLNHFKLNEVIVDGDKVKVFAYSERIPRSLTLHHIPMCVSFGLFLLPEKENSSKGDTLVIIADPSKLEEQVLAACAAAAAASVT